MEHMSAEVLATQFVGVAAGLHEQRLGARCDLRNGQARSGADFPHQCIDLVALDHALRFGGCRLRVHAIFSQQFELAAQYRSEEHTSELQSLMRISYAVFCLKKKKKN